MYTPPVNVDGAIHLLEGLVIGMQLPECASEWAKVPPPTAKGASLLSTTEKEHELIFEEVT
jgi:hypothetical protein